MCEIETERKKRAKMLFGVCALCFLRPISPVHMLKQIKMFTPSSHVSVQSRNAENDPFTHLASKHWAHLFTGFISVELLVGACLSCGGLVFQTGFVYGAFRAGLSLCGQQVQ